MGMPHTFEQAPTGRAKCRGCAQSIAAGVIRFGERVPNPYGDDGSETTHWYHVRCAAFTRPAAFLDTLPSSTESIADRDALEREAALGAAHERLPRVRAAEIAPTGRATCRSCRELIAKDAWRIGLAYYEEGRFVPSGFIHAGCAREYFGTIAILPRLRHFSPSLTDADFRHLATELESPSAPPPPAVR
jgi:hypothetical protein